MCVERAVYIRAQLANIENPIDAQINAIAPQNVQKNKTILPFIVDAVLLCVKQQLALRGHRDDEIPLPPFFTTHHRSLCISLSGQYTQDL
mgnify:CR=1 FL=1